MLDDLLDVVDRNRVYPGKGLVQQNEAGVGCQCARNLGAPALTTGQAHAKTVAEVVDMEFTQQRFEFPLARLTVQVLAGFQNRHDIFGDGQLAKDRGFLRQVADAFAGPAVHRQAGHVLAVDGDLAFIRLDQANDHVETGSFACAVRAEQADDLAAIDGYGHITDDLARFVGLGQMARL